MTRPGPTASSDEGATALRVRYPYRTHGQPLGFPVLGSYANRSAPMKTKQEFAWGHGLGEIVTALADAGLRIEMLREHDYLSWPLPFLVETSERD